MDDHGASLRDRAGGLRPESAAQSQPKALIPSADPFWPLRITSYAPSHRQFRLDETLSPEQITSALGVEPRRTPDGDKVTLQWTFYAELTYRLPDGGFGSVSTGCKIWDYSGARWSAYGWPEAFEQVGLTPLLTQDYGSWIYEEDGNPTLSFLRRALLAASAIEAGTAETAQTGSVHESAVAKPDANPLLSGVSNNG